MLQEKETIYLVYAILGVYTLVQTKIPEIIEISTILIIIFEYFQNLIFMMVITYVIWRSDKKVQQTMASHEVLKLIGLSITIGIVFTILNISLQGINPIGEIDYRLPFLLRLLPLGMMLLIFSRSDSSFTSKTVIVGVFFVSESLGAIFTNLMILLKLNKPNLYALYVVLNFPLYLFHLLTRNYLFFTFNNKPKLFST